MAPEVHVANLHLRQCTPVNLVRRSIVEPLMAPINALRRNRYGVMISKLIRKTSQSFMIFVINGWCSHTRKRAVP